jgi:putative membrane protein insertion efficiency factor
MRRFLVALLCAPIHAYRSLISPLTPPSCRFTPSCSHYALEALHSHGPAKGLFLAARRICRCHPITWLGGSSGFDPVPLSKRHP